MDVRIIVKISEYLSSNFQKVELVPSIYYQWDIGIHFSLGRNIYQFKEDGTLNLDLFELVYKQTSMIFHDLFEPNDDLFLVTNVYKHKNIKMKKARKLKVYQRFIKIKNLLYQIQVRTYPYPFEMDETEEFEMQQFSLLCKTDDIRISGLLKAASNEDFPLKPKFGEYKIDYPDVFFVNITKDVIFFIYDDRGCEVIASDANILRPLYEKYFNWIEDVDRKRIEEGLNKE
jgi:hypothetical protein